LNSNRNSSKVFLSLVIIFSLFVSFGCHQHKISKLDHPDNSPRFLSFSESMELLDKVDYLSNSFKGKAKLTFKDKKKDKDKVFNCALIYKRKEFLRIDAYTSIGTTYFKLFAKPNRCEIYIPLKNTLISGDFPGLEFLKGKNWRSIIPIKSLDLYNLVGLPLNSKPFFMKRELVQAKLYYNFDSGGYGIITFNENDETISKNEQFDLNGKKIAQLHFKEHKIVGNVSYPTNITITDYHSNTILKIDLLDFQPLDNSIDPDFYSLKYPEDVKKENIQVLTDKLSRWFIFN